MKTSNVSEWFSLHDPNQRVCVPCLIQRGRVLPKSILLLLSPSFVARAVEPYDST
jgi:hypothetical protein